MENITFQLILYGYQFNFQNILINNYRQIMKLCSSRNVLLDVSIYDPYYDSQMEDGSVNVVGENSIVLPAWSYIVESEQGVGYRTALEVEGQMKQLFRIEMEEVQSNEIHITKMNEHDISLYQIVTSIEELHRDDTIKIGQYTLKVKDIYLSQPQTIKIHSQIHTPNGPSPQEQNNCRICWQKDDRSDDPLLSVCKCSGSITHTHYSCMKEWFQKYLIKEQSKNSQYYRYGNGKCDLCKQEIPPKITHNQIEYSLIQIKHPKQPHILLELQSKAEVQIICMKFINDQSVVSIGSSEEADICFDDNFVDSIQAVIKMSGSRFWIENKSKYYHTLVKLRPTSQFTNTMGISLCCDNLILCLQAEKGMLDWLCANTTYHVMLS